MNILSVNHLTVSLGSRSGERHVVDDVSFTIAKGEVFGLVGESGSGKSMTALSIMRLLPLRARIVAGGVLLGGTDLARADERAMRPLRGAAVSIVFQDPSSAFNPVFTVGYQLEEAFRAHRTHRDTGDGRRVRAAVLRHLERVRIADPARAFHSYPHQLSGGMKQRAMIAMALMNAPQLVILDEPTTALDVTIQAEILDLLQEIIKRENLSILFISHDFGIIARMCDRVGVMREGRIVETGTAEEIVRRPREAYTRALIDSVMALE